MKPPIFRARNTFKISKISSLSTNKWTPVYEHSGFVIDINVNGNWIEVNTNGPLKDKKTISDAIKANGSWWKKYYNNIQNNITIYFDEQGNETMIQNNASKI